MDTLPRLILRRFSESANLPALHAKTAGEYQARTWLEVSQDVRRFAAKLLTYGLQPGDRVAQFSENRYEWILTDLAMQLLGLVHVPIHSTLAGRQVVDQVTHSGSTVLLVSSPDLLQKIDGLNLPSEVRVAVYDAAPHVDVFDDQATEPLSNEEVQQRAHDVGVESLATVLYTSGTTGEPKGVMLNQRNLTTNAVYTNEAIGQDHSHLRLCFLPLSHIFARTCDLYTWIVGGAQLALVESRETTVADAQAIRPTVLNGVPYFFSSIKQSLEIAGVADQPNIVKNTLGGRLKYCCSGGAALPPDLFDYYREQGTPILQGYGLTESSPVISVSTPSANRRGASGKPIQGVEVSIADDGEVLTRGDHVMCGYYKNEPATREIIRDGWLHTGDWGHLDDDGFLFITGRKKELIVTATGKNISPSYVEALLVEDPTISQALVIGDDRRFLSALIVPDRTYIEKHEPTVKTDEDLQALMAARIKTRLAACAKHEQIAKFTLINRPFSIERGELTAKLSLRRDTIAQNFSKEIEAMYAVS